MTEVNRSKIYKFPGVVLVLATLMVLGGVLGDGGQRVQGHYLQFGDKCQIPRQGEGEVSLNIDCDASKGLICSGEACVCTLADYFSYDPVSNECRKKLGKSCRHMKEDESELSQLPFNLKCHANAQCILVSRSLYSISVIGGSGASRGERAEGDGFSMCVCKPGFVPTDQLSGCQFPPPNISIPSLQNEHEDDEDE